MKGPKFLKRNESFMQEKLLMKHYCKKKYKEVGLKSWVATKFCRSEVQVCMCLGVWKVHMGGVGFWLGLKNLKTQTTYFKEWFQQGGPKATNNFLSTWIKHPTFMDEVKTYVFYSIHS